MNTSEDPNNAQRTMQVHIVDVIERKEGGCTVVVQAPLESDKILEEIWHTVLPGEYQGAMKVGRVWHLYYGQDPRYTPDSWINVPLPNDVRDA
jgi:hypothetical protein